MVKSHIILICLFSSAFFIYLPFDSMTYDLNIDYLCYYDISTNTYVNSCEKGQYCQKFKNGIGICQNLTEDLISKLGEDCDSNFQCDKGLICGSNKKCSLNKDNNNDNIAYKVADSENNNIYYYYCPSEEVPIITPSNDNPYEDQSYICKNPTDAQKGKCLHSESGSRIFPEYLKVCGRIEIDKPTGNLKTYTPKIVNTSDIGEVDEYEIVEDERACKTGYALYFYGNKELNKPGDEASISNMFKRCVNFIESKKLGNGCRIKYSLGDEKEYIYNSNILDSDLKDDKLFTECEFLETKLQFFKDYLKEMTDEKKEECKKNRFYNEPFTCGKDEIRKIWYFYNHPEEYILYKNEEDIINFLLQQAYPSYGNNKNSSESDSSDSTQSSTFVNIKYFISLLILLSF